MTGAGPHPTGPSRILLVAGAIALAIGGGPGAARPASPAEAHQWIAELMSSERKARRSAAARLTKARNPRLLPALVDAYFFTPRARRAELQKVLKALTGESFERYWEWVEYIGAREGLEPEAGYLEWKVSLFRRIDDGYREILYPNAPSRIRLEEVVSGGVRIAGIPALDDPPMIPGEAAGYLVENERVFGVLLGGEARAYPLRILDWHELMNDVVAEQPVTLSYCTLCGSGILYSARTPAGGRYTFDTSGLLYRSNKLMVDRQSRTLWGNLTGRPVFGRLAATSAQLEMLPMTLTTWGEWFDRHPESLVLDLEGVRRHFAPRYAYDYRPGVADRSRAGVSFPVWLRSDVLPRDEQIFALTVKGVPKAYPLEDLLRLGVVNDTIGESPLVLVADASAGSIRVYERAGHQFMRGADPRRVADDAGHEWSVEEDKLVPSAEGLEPLARLPGHVARWFGWYAFYPRTELFGSESRVVPGAAVVE